MRRSPNPRQRTGEIGQDQRDQRGAEVRDAASRLRERREKLTLSGDWRARKQEMTEQVDLSKVYGDAMPAEWKLAQMYHQFKGDNNQFTTWLVESVYPHGTSTPSYITLSRKQTKGECQHPPLSVPNQQRPEHDKYEIIVNQTVPLARQIETVPSTMMTVLDRLIATRTEYTYWMSRKPSDDFSKAAQESHEYYIEVLSQVRTILAERMEPGARISPRTTSPSRTQGQTFARGQRKNSSNDNDWRRVRGGSCEKT